IGAGNVAILGAQCAPNTSSNPPPGDCPTNATKEHLLVTDDPKVTVVEYGDIQCPVCGRFARETYPTIKTNYIDTGKIRWEFRHFPLRSIHVYAERAAEAAECAHQQDKFF